MTKRIKTEKDRVPTCYNRIYPLVILAAILFMGIGYAQINSINMTISGNALAIIPSDVYITSATISGGTNGANTEGSNISSYTQTMLSSNIILSQTNINSTLSMQVSIKNNSNKVKYFDDIISSSALYSNHNIDYTLTGLTKGDPINPGDTITTTLTFKYSDTYKNSSPTQPYNNTLESTIEYNFEDSIAVEYAVTISGINFTPTQSELHAHEGETYTINLQSANYYLIVTMNGTTLSENTGYTFSSGILSIPNVIGNISILAASKEVYNFVIDEPVNVHTISGQSSISDTSSMTAETISNKNITKIGINFQYSSGNKVYSVNIRLKQDGNEIKTQQFDFTQSASNAQASITLDGFTIPANSNITIEYDSTGFKENSKGNGTLTIGEITYNITFDS